MASSSRRLTAIALLLLAAISAHRASVLGWGDAAAPDGTRYRLAPNGLVHLPTGPGAPLSACRWFPLRGTDPLCQATSGAAPRFTRLTYAYPTLQAGAWLSFLGMMILVLAGPPANTLIRITVGLGVAALLGGIALMLDGAPSSVQALAPLAFRYGGTGLTLGVAAPVLALLAALCIPPSGGDAA